MELNLELIASGVEFIITHIGIANILFGILIIMLATVVQYGVGVGFGLLAGPLLALLNIEFVPVPVLILTFITSVSAALSEWRLVKVDQLKISVGGRIMGSILAAMLLGFMPDENSFMLMFGIVVGVMVVVSVGGIKIPFNLVTIGVAGFISGITATITSVGGPPMAAVYQNQKPKDARPTLQVFFAIGSFASFMVLLFVGYVKSTDFLIAACLLPGTAMGFLLGPKLRPFFDKNFRPWILGIAAVASILLIQRGLS